MIILFITAYIAATFVDIKAIVEGVRNAQIPRIFDHGTKYNVILAIYYTLISLLTLVVAHLPSIAVPSFFDLPAGLMILKVFYIGFAGSVNAGFLLGQIKHNSIPGGEPPVDDVPAGDLRINNPSSAARDALSWLIIHLRNRTRM